MPETAYGILHATEAYLTLFQKEIITVDQATKSIASEGAIAPCIADAFALGSNQHLPRLWEMHPTDGLSPVGCVYATDHGREYSVPKTNQGNRHQCKNADHPGRQQHCASLAHSRCNSNILEDAAPKATLLLDSAQKQWNMDILQLSMLNLDKAGEEVSHIAGSTKSAESHFMAFGSESSQKARNSSSVQHCRLSRRSWRFFLR